MASLRRKLSVGSILKRDVKTVDISLAENLVSTASPKLLFKPIGGPDDGERIGRKTVILNYMYKIVISNPRSTAGFSTGNDECIVARLIFYVDKQPNHATHSSTDLLVSATSLAHYNVDNRSRFRIISDKSYLFSSDSVLRTPGATDYAFVEHKGHLTYKLVEYKEVNIETIFNSGTAGTIADIESGAFYLLCISSSTGVGGCGGNFRISYTDC